MAVTRSAVIRADAGRVIGGGHVMRCLALAGSLADSGWDITFAGSRETVETIPALARSGHRWIELSGDADSEHAALEAALGRGCDLLIVDHYGRGVDFESACRGFARRILAIDDEPKRHHDCDLLLDSAPGTPDYAGLVPPGCTLLLGPAYALLRPQFALARPAALARHKSADAVTRIFVSLGTTDPDGLTGPVLTGIAATNLGLDVDVVLGAAAPHLPAVRALAQESSDRVRIHVDASDMAALMAAADLAVGAGGATSFERCCLGLPTLVVLAAENQRRNVEALVAASAVVSLGEGTALTPDKVAAALRALTADTARRPELSENAAALCDGRGASRVAEALSAAPARSPVSRAG